MKPHAVVVPREAQRDEVFARPRRDVAVQLDVHVTVRGI